MHIRIEVAATCIDSAETACLHQNSHPRAFQTGEEIEKGRNFVRHTFHGRFLQAVLYIAQHLRCPLMCMID